jgi:preprotein translocase subunit SecF
MSKKHHGGTHAPVAVVNGIGATAYKYQNYFFFIPVVSSLLAIAALVIWGLHAGIDLKGGSLLQVSYPDGRPDQAALQTKVDALDYGEIRIQPSNEKEYIFRQRDLSNDEKNALSEVVNSFGKAEEVQFNSVGPSIGAELMQKAWWAIGMITLLTIAFIAWAFRGVSEPVASWKYGVVAIITLLHDILIPAGLFAYLGHVRGAEVGALFIVALLTILGISINDTIVVFDRIRENLNLNINDHHKQEDFGAVVWRSIMQTLTRSINTSVTVIVMLVALFWYGPASTEDFSLTLIVGMLAGTYSSILVASPLLILIEKRQKPKVVAVTKSK